MFVRDKIGNSGGSSGGVPITASVNTFADLPDASTHLGQYFIVNTSTGIWIVNRKEKGIYRAIGPTATDWERLGNWVEAFNSANFEVYDNSVSTNAMTIDTSGLSGKRAVKIPDENGTIAYSTGLTGGQVLMGGKASGEDLTLDSTQNASKGDIKFNSNTMFNSGFNFVVQGDNYAFISSVAALAGLFFNVSTARYQFKNTAGNSTFEVYAGSSGSINWFRHNDNSGDLRLDFNGDGGQLKIITTTDTAKAALFLDQNDTDVEFTEYEGDLQSDLSGNITSITNAAIAGFTKEKINNTVRWKPYYSAPTSKITVVNAATYDLLVTDFLLHVTYTGTGPVTSFTIPTDQNVEGREFTVNDAGGNAGTNNITIDTEGSALIDNNATFVLSTNNEAITLYFHGSDWFSK